MRYIALLLCVFVAVALASVDPFISSIEQHYTRMPSAYNTLANMTKGDTHTIKLEGCAKNIIRCTSSLMVYPANPDFRPIDSPTDETSCWRTWQYNGETPSPTVVVELAGWCKN